MKMEIKIPEAGESIVEGFLASWSVPDGSFVEEGQPLFEFETDKTTLDISAPAQGRLSIAIPSETDVTVGQTAGYIDTEAAPPKAAAPPASRPDEAAPAPAPAAAVPSPSPAALRQASLKGVDPGAIPGTGRRGQVTKADVLKGAAVREPSSPSSSPPPASSLPLPSGLKESERREPLSRIRQKIAENLGQTQKNLVLLTTFNEVDMTRVKALRNQYKEEFIKRYNTKLGFMSFFLKASAAALRTYPAINATIDGKEVVYRDHIHISVAVSTPKGLITPVLRFVDQKPFAALEGEIIDFGQRAAAKKLGPDELMGGTFTVTNGGVFGSLLSTPLPSPGQSAILGMHTIQERPVAVAGQVEIRPMMYLALTYDHRLVDGREAVGFLKTIKQAVEEPERLLLEI